ncbi:MAG: sodium:solute symporter [Hyphomonadaceae bacterium]
MAGLDPTLMGALILAYVAVQIGIGVWISRKVRSETDYFVAGRNLGFLAVSLSVFATWFGAETILSSSAEIAGGGLAGGRAEPFGYALCLVGMALFIAGAFRAQGYLTLADFFRARFGRWAELACVWLTIPVSIIWAAAQLMALAALMQTALNIPPNITLFAAAILVMTYTAFGGLMGDVATDMVQSVVLIIGLLVALGAVVARMGGWDGLFASIEPAQLRLVGEGETWLARADAWAVPVLGSLVTQEAISRFLAAKSPALARNACFGAAGLYLAVGTIPVLIGLAGVHVGAPGAEGDNFMPALLREIAHPVVFIFFAGALLSAILSTADSNVLSVSSLISVNLFPRAHAALSDRMKLIVARAATVAASLIALAIAAGGASIRDLITLTSVLGQAGLLVAVLFGLRSRFGGERAALAGVIAAVGANVWTLAIWPMQQMAADGVGFGESLGLMLAGEAPALDGAFLLSVLAALAGYVAVGWWERTALGGGAKSQA